MQAQKRYITLISNVFYFFLSTVFTRLLSYFLLPVFTANMSTGEYGTADILMSTVNFLYPIFALGMSGALVRYAMEKEDDISIVFTSAGKVIIATSLVSLITIPILRLFPSLRGYAVYVPVFVFLINASTLVNGLCMGLNRTKLLMVRNIIYGVVLFSVSYTLIKVLKWGIEGYMVSHCLAYLVSGVITMILLKIGRYINLSAPRKSYHEYYGKLLRYGVPLVPNSLAWWVTQLSDRYMVTYWYGATANGLYAVAYKIPSILKAVVSVFMEAWNLSAISEYKSKDAVSFYNFIYRHYCMACYVIAGGVIFLSKPLATVLLANEFYEAWKYVPVLVLAAAAGSQEEYMGSLYLAEKRTNKYFISSLIGAGINVILNLILIPHFAIWGASVATLISYAVVYIYRARDIKSTMGISIQGKKNVFALIFILAETILYVITGTYRYIASLTCIICVLTVFHAEACDMWNIIKTKIIKRK